MNFENLTINRIVAHEVFERKDDRSAVQPDYGAALVVLSDKALEELAERIVHAMGSASKSMEMVIADSGAQSAVVIARDLLNTTPDPDFVRASHRTADKLSNAQTSRAIPGGVLVVIEGSVGYPARKMVALIKAEVQSGFRKKQQPGGGITVEFLSDLFLTPEAKLYKIGAFIAPATGATAAVSADWLARVYDVGMSANNRLAAAQYFYNGFLGCEFPQNAAKYTKQFHDLTRSFIKSLDVPEEDKSDLHNALVTYLKVDKGTTIQVSDFGTSYFKDAAVKDSFNAYMADQGFTAQPVQKDISDLGTALRFRHVIFRRNVRLIAPAESFGELITMETIDGDPSNDGQVPKWTKIIVKEQIQGQS